MKAPRRNVLKSGALIAASLLLPRTVSAGPDSRVSVCGDGFTQVNGALLAYFAALGLKEIPPSPIVTGDQGFNGGLRHDDTGVLDPPGHMVVQPCARISDISEKHRQDILPLFHIFRGNGLPGQNREDAFSHVMGYLTGPLQLDPTRLAIVSIPPFEDLRPLAEKSGIDWAHQVVLRDADMALNAGDGSGIFRHPGDARVPAIPTAGLYYWVGDGPAHPARKHPLPAMWTEIGELFIAEKSGAAFAFGAERLVLASSGAVPTWDHQLDRLLAQIDRDSAGGPVPAGKAIFARS